MFGWRRWRDNRIIAGSWLDARRWDVLVRRIPALRRLDADQLEQLRRMAILFLHHKAIHGVGGLALDDQQRAVIAAQACLPVLALGLDWYRHWHSVLVYPDVFVADHEYMDEFGVMHRENGVHAGESWDEGPVILAWSQIAAGGAAGDGYNLVIHEFAHKLDSANGVANGMPPLHRGMSRKRWTRTFTAAWDDFRGRLEAGEQLPIDEYAAEAPEEFFAVLSEAFFEIPDTVRTMYPDVYRQLCEFYRQDPSG